jgi:hypothetical protein
MSIKNICSKLAIGAGVIALLIISSNPNAFAKTVTVNGSGQGTDLTSAFSFDGVAPALSIVSTGKDNIGGTFNTQDVGEYSFTATSCTAPDGTAGTAFILVQAAAVINYRDGTDGKDGKDGKDGQLYLSGTSATGNSGCTSSTTPGTGSYGLTETQSITGGTGKFAHASGSITFTVVGTGLAAPGSPPGALGSFGAFQYTTSGSVNF